MIPHLVGIVTLAFELAGIGVILGGAMLSTASYCRSLWRLKQEDAYRRLRSNLGRSILLGLELLVAADIINTVAVEPSLESVAVLGGIVLIRTLLSVALEVEIEGRWPWRRHTTEGMPSRVAPECLANARGLSRIDDADHRDSADSNGQNRQQ